MHPSRVRRFALFALCMWFVPSCALDTPANPEGAHLEFVTVPVQPVAGGEFLVAVAVEDREGHVLAHRLDSIALSLRGPGKLAGHTVAQAINGVASFNDLSIDVPGETYSLVASTNSLTAQSTSAPFTVSSAIIAGGVWWVKTCRPSLMAPGYTLVYPLEGSEAYWFQGCSVARLMDMPGRVGVLRQDSAGIFGLVGSSVLAFQPDGTVRFALYQFHQLPAPAHHDVVESPRGTFFTLLKVTVAPPDTFDDMLVEYTPDGTLLWSWDVNQHLLGGPALNLYGENWTHSNALDLFPNGDILLSVRNLNEIVRIAYPSGDTVWVRGTDTLAGQHNARLYSDGTISVMNNGVLNKVSRVTEFDSTGSVILDHSLGWYSDALGSVERESNGNWLVVDGKGGRVLEYTPDFSQIVLELRLLRGNYVPYAPNPPVRAWLYRATRQASLP